MGYAPNNAPFAPKPKTPPPPKKDNPAKDAIFHQCGEVGHWRRKLSRDYGEVKKLKPECLSPVRQRAMVKTRPFLEVDWFDALVPNEFNIKPSKVSIIVHLLARRNKLACVSMIKTLKGFRVA
ncbi:hypothetical protein Tco_0097818 [Tanacetum coccineum]